MNRHSGTSRRLLVTHTFWWSFDFLTLHNASQSSHSLYKLSPHGISMMGIPKKSLRDCSKSLEQHQIVIVCAFQSSRLFAFQTFKSQEFQLVNISMSEISETHNPHSITVNHEPERRYFEHNLFWVFNIFFLVTVGCFTNCSLKVNQMHGSHDAKQSQNDRHSFCDPASHFVQLFCAHSEIKNEDVVT